MTTLDGIGGARVVIAAVLTEHLVHRLRESFPHVDVVWEPTLLAPPLFEGDSVGDPGYRRSATAQRAFQDLCASADILYGVPDYSPRTLARVIEQSSSLAWVHGVTAGVGGVLKEARLSTERLNSVRFTTSAGVHARPLAEFALLGALAGLKELGRLLDDQRAGQWPPRRAYAALTDATVAIVGAGHVGQEVARVMRPLARRVIAFDRVDPDLEGVEFRPMTALRSSLAEASVLILALPETDATRGLIDRSLLSICQKGVTIVNVGRGAVIDEVAMIDALRAGTVGFAALDVFASEPLPLGHQLWTLPNVLVSPHSAAARKSEPAEVLTVFMENLRLFLAGAPLKNPVNVVEFY